jgi:hypothetical protein
MTRVKANQRWITAAQNIGALLATEQIDFVECAYLTILNRAPDESGLAHYGERLRIGHPKMDILSDLYASAEARQENVQIPWLRRAIFRHKLQKLFRIRVAGKRYSKSDRQFAIERRLDLLDQRVTSLSRQLELRIAELDNLAQVLGEWIEADKRSVPANMTAPDFEARLSASSLVTQRVFKQLSDAIAEASRQAR